MMDRQDFLEEELFEHPFSTLTASELLRELNDVQIHGEVDVATVERFTSNRENRNYLRGFVLRKVRLEVKSQRLISGPIATALFGAILSLPLDVCFEILSHLHPIDLYHLSITSKSLRKLVISPALTFAWQRSFEEHREVAPPCPPGISKPQWATFLFGSTVCEDCGSVKAHLDFGLMRRLCDICWRKITLYKTETMRWCKGHPHSLSGLKFGIVWGMSRRSAMFDASLKWTKTGRYDGYFLKEDIFKNLAFACPQCDERGPSWIQIKDETILEVGAHFEHAQQSVRWAINLFEEIQELEKAFYEGRLRKHFDKLKYTSADFENASSNINEYFTTMSMRGLSKIDLRCHVHCLSPFLKTIQQKRLREENRNRVINLYRDYKRQMDESEEGSPDDGISSNATVTHEVFASAVADWRKNRKQELLRILQLYEDDVQSIRDLLGPPTSADPASKSSSSSNRRRQRWGTPQNKTPIPLKALDLALLVFTCDTCLKVSHRSGVALCGYDAILTHMCGSQAVPHCTASAYFSWCSEGKDVVVNSLLKSLGRDPAGTTAAEMDEVDARWACEISGWDGSGWKVLNWRECVTYTVLARQREEVAPRFHLLTPVTTRFVKGHERATYPGPEKPVWGCSHCSEHLVSAVRYGEALEHVVESHNIETPKRNHDIIHFPHLFLQAGVYRQRRPFIYKVNAHLENRHLRESHGINEAVEGTDWERVQIYS
ncbi:hypothetical protein H1R20_g15831, partial [Candolleomyces eurysporus]